MCVFMITFYLFDSQNVAYFYKLKLFKYVACRAYVHYIYYCISLLFAVFFNYCRVKAPTVYHICKMGE